MFDIYAVGELLIDFTPTKDGAFKPNPGGAPCNFLTSAQKMGAKTAFIGKVGDDAFGRMLKSVLEAEAIDVSSLHLDTRYGTTLAFVHLNPDGERSFSFYRRGCADVMLSEEDIDFDILNETRALHFGSLSFTDEPSRSAVLKLIESAKSKSKLITYDPNYRKPLWESEDEAVEYMLLGMKYADIVKVSDEELELLTGTNDNADGCKRLHEMGVKMIFVTLGGNGCYYSYAGGTGIVGGIAVKVLDTTGAGDTFFGAAIQQILELKQSIEEIKAETLERILKIANVAAGICIEGYGGIPSIPSKEEVVKRLG